MALSVLYVLLFLKVMAVFLYDCCPLLLSCLIMDQRRCEFVL